MFSTKWGWYGWIYGLAKQDITKVDEILNMNGEEVLVWICYEIDKYKFEEKQRSKKQ